MMAWKGPLAETRAESLRVGAPGAAGVAEPHYPSKSEPLWD